MTTTIFDQYPQPKTESFFNYAQRHKKLLVGVGLSAWLFSSIVTLTSFEPNYVAKGMVIVKDTAITSKYVTGDNYETTASPSTNSVINTMGLLKADVYTQSLWDFFRFHYPETLKKKRIKNYSDWESYFGDGSKFIKYSNLPGTDMIAIEFKWDDPKVAREALDEVIKVFRGLSLELNQSEQHERSNFLQQQVRDIEVKLQNVRSRISRFKEDNQVIDTAEENSNLARARVNLKTDLAAAQAEGMGKARQASGYQQLLGMNPRQAVTASAIGQNENLAKQYTELYNLRSEKNSLQTRYTDESPKIQEINSRLQQIESNINKELARTIGASSANHATTKGYVAVTDSMRSNAVGQMLSAKTDAMSLGAKSRVLNSYLKELDARAKKLAVAESKLSEYKLEETTYSEALRTLREKEIDARLKETQTLSNVFPVQKSHQPLKASFPTKTHMLVIDLLLGVALGFAAVFVKFILRDRQFDVEPDYTLNIGTKKSPKQFAEVH